ncbi:MAG: CHAT domain-containing protein [Pyrinomonadaceae bacterium]|nr:CHAT domain-containing protein [Pyrinomonadaceae bacterium]
MKKNISRLIYVFVLSFALPCFGQNSNPPKTEMPALEFGQTVEREIAGGKRHDYKISLANNQFVKIEAEQIGCDVIFALYTDDGNFFDVNNSTVDGVETSIAAVEKSGDYNLQVVSMSEQTGVYKLKIAERRTATEKELHLTAGINLNNRAFLKTTSSSTTESIRQGIAENEAALVRARLSGNKKLESRVLNDIGTSYGKLGDIEKSVAFYQQAVEISSAIDDKYEIAMNLSNLGTAYQMRGDWQQAFDAFFQSLEFRRAVKHSRGEAASLNKIGCLFKISGDANRALEYFGQALEIFRKDNMSKNYEADTLENFGAAYLALNEPEKARDAFQKALEIARKSKSRRREASFLNRLGELDLRLGETAKASGAFDESLKIALELGDKQFRAAALKNIGQAQSARGEIDQSLASFNQSAEIYRAVEDAPNLAETLLLTSKAEAQQNNFEAAQNKAEEAINLTEKIRARVQTAGLRDSFSANLQNYYAFYIEILMARHKLAPDKNFAALALSANERARARGLLNLLAESNADIRQGVDEKLLQKETNLKNLLAARLENLTKVLNGKAKTETAEKLKTEIEQIRAEYEQTQTQIRASSPRYAALTQPKTLDLQEIQRQVLDVDSVLLEYALGETKSFLWIITQNDFQAVELPAKAEIEKTARQFYESLTARNRQIKFETPTEREDRIFLADSDAQKFSGELSRIILAPAAAFLTNKRLLIVADGALQYVPFSSLESPGSRKAKDQKPKTKNRFLIESNEIVNLPSVSVLAVLRKETQNRKLPAKTLAVLADPVFDEADERMPAVIGKNKSKTEYITVSKKQTRNGGDFATRNGLNLPRLPFTRREADSITAFVPPNQRKKFFDFAANRQTAMSSELADYRFVHFATHGFINNENPELSGIVLSLFDENGKEQDGFLRVGDIYNLKLPVETVVLSGCKTGLGKEIKGEGLVGLTRGFMYAGARRVAVSLWDVNDEATAELMGKFYRKMLDGEKLSPAAALRGAQIEMIKDKRWQNPYFWSVFTLQGEPR